MTAPATLDIGSRLELLIDNYLIEETRGSAGLRLHQPRPAGVAFRFDQPWEGPGSGYCTVIKDGEACRLYFRGWRDTTDHEVAVTCVAESDDALTFHRPELELYEVEGVRRNNVILANEMTTHNFAPMLDDRPGVPEDQRYKAMGRNFPSRFSKERGQVCGLIPFASPDGIHWRRLSEEAVITEGAFDSQNVPFWSEHEACYLCYFRVFTEGKRAIARARSDDFLQWSDPEQMQFGDTPREQLYTNQTLPYFRAPHLYTAMPGRFMPGRQVLSDEEGKALGISVTDGKARWHDCSDAVLLTSRGGDRYDRTFMEAFVRPGLDRHNWTTRCNYPARGIVQTGEDEMSIYIERHAAHQSKYLERLTLRLDGLASLSAGYDGGTMRTKPLTFSGSRLILNYSTSAAGHIRVAIQDEDGQFIEGRSLEDCQYVIGDEIEREVSWGETTDISALAGRPVRLLFELKDADLYTLRFAESESR